MNRVWQFGTALLAAGLVGLMGQFVFAEELAKAQSDEVARQVKTFLDSGPLDRKAAADKLVEVGREAVAPLAEEAAEGRAATMYHCFDVLGRLLASDNAETSKVAKEALDKLSDSDNRSVALRAKTIIRLREVLGKREALQRAVPAIVPAAPVAAAPVPQGPLKLNHNENGKSIQLERAADGSFSGKIEEPAGNDKKTTEIKAADARELEQKFPEAHQALKKHEERMRNRQPALPFGGGFNANVVVNGGAATQKMTVKIVNGDRTIEAQAGDEKVEIHDKNGKDIELKHTRPVDGKSKTDEYKAADLDDLKKKHPEAARLYEKYATGNGIGAAPQIQIQAVPGVFRAANGGLRLTPAEVGSTSPGPRTIRAELDDRKIEITDEEGRNIRVTVTKVVDGKEVREEFPAENLKALKAEHPEAARLYEKYTGTRAE